MLSASNFCRDSYFVQPPSLLDPLNRTAQKERAVEPDARLWAGLGFARDRAIARCELDRWPINGNVRI
jgi:hypothetical protein